MNTYQLANYFGQMIVSHASLKSMLSEYTNPNDKIYRLLADKQLLSLKKGLYIFSPELAKNTPPAIIVANQLIGPSYVSLEYALSYYQAIPERVYVVTSVTTKPTKSINTPIGRYTYSHISKSYYNIGLKQVACENGFFGIIACPEKAIIDTIVMTKGLIFRSLKDVSNYLIEDMRIDEDWLRKLNIQLVTEIQQYAQKKKSIQLLINYLQSI